MYVPIGTAANMDVKELLQNNHTLNAHFLKARAFPEWMQLCKDFYMNGCQRRFFLDKSVELKENKLLEHFKVVEGEISWERFQQHAAYLAKVWIANQGEEGIEDRVNLFKKDNVSLLIKALGKGLGAPTFST